MQISLGNAASGRLAVDSFLDQSVDRCLQLVSTPATRLTEGAVLGVSTSTIATADP